MSKEEIQKKQVELLRVHTEIVAAETKLKEIHQDIDKINNEFHNLSVWTAHCLRDFATDNEVQGINKDFLLKIARIKKIQASKVYDNQLGIIVGVQGEAGVCSKVTMHIPSTDKHVQVNYSDVEIEKPHAEKTWSTKIKQIIENGILKESPLFAYEWDAVEKNIFVMKIVPTDEMLASYKEEWAKGKIRTRIHPVSSS